MTGLRFAPAPNNLPPLEDRGVHLWRVDLSGEPLPGTDLILDANERRRAARFVFDRDRNRFLRAHHALRVLLGAYLGEPPDGICIESNRHGKPRVVGQPLGFNISHSADCGLIAISKIAEIGVDLEMLRLPSGAGGIAESVFSATERESLADMSNEEFASAFFTCWTRKEAYLKALGVGLMLNPATVTVGVKTNRVRLTRPERGAGEFVDVVSIAERSDRAEAVAVVGGFSDLAIFEYGYSSP